MIRAVEAGCAALPFVADKKDQGLAVAACVGSRLREALKAVARKATSAPAPTPPHGRHGLAGQVMAEIVGRQNAEAKRRAAAAQSMAAKGAAHSE